MGGLRSEKEYYNSLLKQTGEAIGVREEDITWAEFILGTLFVLGAATVLIGLACLAVRLGIEF